MSTPGEQEEAAVEETEPAAEPRQMSERTAKAILLVVAAGAMWGIVAAAPWVAYVVVGILLDRGWLKVRGWIGRRQADGDDAELDDEDGERAPHDGPRLPTFHELCESLARVGTPHAHVAVLAEDLGTTSERVREALDRCGVSVEPVRMRGRGSSTGVKGGALPTPRPAQGSDVVAGGADNNDNDNADEDTPGKGLRVEPIGLSGTVTYHPADSVRHHQIK